jgi:ATP-dependent protease HslVU (ClpYQ) peptidase subunit
MTTIACDGKTMAADSRGSRGDLIVSNVLHKLVRLGDGSILGIAGRSSTAPLLAAWIEGKGEFPENSGDWSALHLTSKELRLYSSESGKASNPLSLPAAIGSGAELALGAMLAGATPDGAVTIAATRDPFTGGPIHTLRLDHA